MKNIRTILTSFFAIFLIVACSSDSDDSTDIPTVKEFDRGTILTNYVDNIIIPRYNDFKNSINVLSASVETFVGAPTVSAFDKMHDDWVVAYKNWQHIEMFNISKAEQMMYLDIMNAYPVNVDRIESNIGSEKTDLSDVLDKTTQGFPGLDYMLHGLSSSKEDIINIYSVKVEYGKYLKNLMTIMVTNTNTIIDDWEANKADFVSSTGNTRTSSLNMITNDFIYYFEKGLRSNKISTPGGWWSQGVLYPKAVEAYFSSINNFEDVSKVLAKEGLIASQNFFEGKAKNGVAGSSLKTYLQYIYNNNVIDNDLGTTIVTNMQNAMTKIDALDDNFVNQVNNDSSKMIDAHSALQKVVVNLKTTMLSSLSMYPDYEDADGD